jgi:hypothetical protein
VDGLTSSQARLLLVLVACVPIAAIEIAKLVGRRTRARDFV